MNAWNIDLLKEDLSRDQDCHLLSYVFPKLWRVSLSIASLLLLK
jgi:hypothetical protein